LQTKDQDEPGRARAPVLSTWKNLSAEVDAPSPSLSLSLVFHHRPLHPRFISSLESSRLIFKPAAVSRPNVAPLKTMRFVNAGYRYRHLCLVARRISFRINPTKPVTSPRTPLDGGSFFLAASAIGLFTRARVSGGANRSLARARTHYSRIRPLTARSLLFPDGPWRYRTMRDRRLRPRSRDGTLRFVISLIYFQILSVTARIDRSVARSIGWPAGRRMIVTREHPPGDPGACRMTPQMTLRRKWLAAATADDDAASRGDLAMKSSLETTMVIADVRESQKNRSERSMRQISVSNALPRVGSLTFNRES